jgi:hypothetical protein
MTTLRVRAKQMGRECSVTVEQLEEILHSQDYKCFYTGMPITLELGHQTLSVDRIDPTKGYVPGNIAMTAWIINNMKRDLSHERFIDLCKAVVAHHS